MNSIALINQPPHFFSALLVIACFLTAVFSKNEKFKKPAHGLLYLGYVLMIITGGVIFATLPFSIFVLIKSVGGLALIVMAEILVRQKGGTGTRIIWALLLVTATAGLAIAYFLI